MIVVRIWEGLGNQLFQYAYARALQERLQIPVYLDKRHNNRGDLPHEEADVHRQIGLQHFNTSLKYADTRKIRELHYLDSGAVLKSIHYSMLKTDYFKWKIVEDANDLSAFLPHIYSPKDFTYINAHCINKRYYYKCRNILLEEFKLNKKIRISAELENIMENKNTVSLHIRLKDYLNHPGWIRNQNYYDRAINYIQDRIENPFFVIFTDDLAMARKMYRFHGNVYWVSDEHCKDYEELILMSKCKHNIIAGSTFSYWGAWLNQNTSKIVIRPRDWFRDSLYEEEWLPF
jgi:hypothetical protein